MVKIIEVTKWMYQCEECGKKYTSERQANNCELSHQLNKDIDKGTRSANEVEGTKDS